MSNELKQSQECREHKLPRQRIETHHLGDGLEVEERFEEDRGTAWLVLRGLTTYNEEVFSIELSVAEAYALAACLEQAARKMRRMQG